MLRKFCRHIFAFILIVCFTVPSVFAASNETNSSVSTFELSNGDRIEVITTVIPSYSRSSKSETAAERSFNYISFSGDKLFTYVLYGEFEYDGKTSRATYVDYAIEIYDSTWDVDNHSESISGSSVYGSAKFDGPLFLTKTISGSLTCDKNGNIT